MSEKKPAQNQAKKDRNRIWILVASFFVAFSLISYFSEKSLGPELDYSEFQKLLAEKKVQRVVISDHALHGERIAENGKPTPFTTNRVDPELARELTAAGVPFSQVAQSSGFWANPFFWVMAFFVLPYLFQLFTAGGARQIPGALPFGRSRAKIHIEPDTQVTFDDVAGANEAKSELQEVVRFLKSPAQYGRLGARIPRGVLLVGPPGTGKTLLSKAVAGEAGVPFFSINGSEFVEMFVGVGAARVRDLFMQAREKSPCIIFIDELDALGRSRASNIAGSNDEKEQTLNQLLSELDGFDNRDSVVLLAATNRPEVLDPALLRSGRFDRQILMDRPDRQERIEILKVHAKKIKVDAQAELEKIAAMTTGFTGADIANLVNEAALVATRRNAETVNLDDFSMALERIIAGLEKKNRLLSPHERRVVAYHEMGHAFIGATLPFGNRIHKVSIIPRGIGSLGYTIQRPTEDRYLMTQRELETKMTVLLGGRAAEELVFHEPSTGAADDIVKATNIARSMVMSYGMESRLGPIAYDGGEYALPSQQNYLGQTARSEHSEQTQLEIDSAVRSLVNTSLSLAIRILRHNRDLLKEAAELLLTKETLTEAELEPIFRRLSRADASSHFPMESTVTV